ncbi:MAG TPA: TonB-dependent receptor [Chitinophagaceae bacterium]|nr:TonB-dependent receptor [Chitinophagaceae bacterium]
MRKLICCTLLLLGCVLWHLPAQSQEKTVSGVVSGDDSLPLPGVTVNVKGTKKSTLTNADGRFSLSASRGDVLQLSYVGFATQELKVGDNDVLSIILQRGNAGSLEDVVVVGYGTQRKANLTGAVSTVDVNRTFGSKPLNDPAKALQGITPGLNIQFGNGGLTAGASINIRGIGSINGSSRPLILVDNVETTDLSIINPNDIESISVLKDAASTSIYGARAAFGVVLIKTKSGKKNQKMTVQYNNYFSANKATSLPDFADPVAELQGLNEAGLRSGQSSPETFGMNLVKLRNGIINWKQKYAGKNGNEMVKGEDWDIDATDGRAYFFKVWDPKKEMLNKYTFSQQHNINIQGGSDKISYYLSGGYSYDGGMFKLNPDRVNKYNFTVGLNASPTKWLDLNIRTLNRNFSYDYPYGYQDYWYYFWRWGAYFPYGTYQGNYFRTNSAYLAGASKANITSNYQRVDLGATLKISKDISIRADYTIARDNSLRHETSGPIMAWDYWSAGPLNLVDLASSTNATTYTSGRMLINTFNTYATYQHSFAAAHNVKLTAGINAEKDETINFFASRKGLLDPTQGELALTFGDASIGTAGSGVLGWPTNGHGKRAFAGYFGRLNYDYKGKYLFEVNGRYDGSSFFPVQDRWAFFPSASAGYRISEESFMEPIKPVLSDLKVRASYGELGNQDVGGAFFLPNMNGISVNWLTPTGTALTPAVSQPLAVASTLKWERVSLLDFGADIKLFKNHIGVTFDWYERNTKGMIQASSVPSSFGTTGPRINAGNFRTRGYEISIDANYSVNKDLQLYGTLSFWDYKTVFTEWNNPNNSISNAFNYKGKTYGEIWGLETQGFFASDAEAAGSPSQKALQSGNFAFGAGDIRYVDRNKDGSINGGAMTLSDHGDLKVIGNTQPRYQYNARIGGTWKNFDFDVFIQGVGKRDWWGIGNVALPMYQSLDILYDNQLDYWTPTNTNAKYPRLNANNNVVAIAGLNIGSNNFVPQTRYLLNLAYCRLKNVTLGYTLPQGLLRRYSIQKLRVFVSGQNLAEISNVGVPIDPEMTDGSTTSSFTGRNWPFVRQYSAGVQLSF